MTHRLAVQAVVDFIDSQGLMFGGSPVVTVRATNERIDLHLLEDNKVAISCFPLNRQIAVATRGNHWKDYEVAVGIYQHLSFADETARLAAEDAAGDFVEQVENLLFSEEAFGTYGLNLSAETTVPYVLDDELEESNTFVSVIPLILRDVA